MKSCKILIVLAAVLLVTMACTGSPKKDDNEMRKAAETNTALGRQYMERGQYEISLEKLKRAIAQDKTYAPAHTMLAVLYETIGETEDAEQEFRLAVKYDPSDGDVNNNLGAFLCRNGKMDEADRYFQVALDDPFYTTPAIALTNAGSCALSRNDLVAAEDYLRRALEQDRRMASALLPMAEVMYRKGSHLQARAFLQRYEAVGPDTEESLYLGYVIETALGNERTAGSYLDRLNRDYPGSIQSRERNGRGTG